MSAIVIICPGFHPPDLTQAFIEAVDWQGWELLVFPTDIYPAYSGIDIYNFLQQHRIEARSPLVFVSFSAGVVGAIAAAWLWQLSGKKVAALIAFDGWGVPLFGNFQIYRFSHDYLTHITSSWLGSGKESFYAQPSVAHLDLWRSPPTAIGYVVGNSHFQQATLSASSYLESLLAKVKYIP